MSAVTVSVTQAKNTLSALLNRVAIGRERLIVESRGKPKAAIISIADLKLLEMIEAAIVDDVTAGNRSEVAQRAAQFARRLINNNRALFEELARL